MPSAQNGYGEIGSVSLNSKVKMITSENYGFQNCTDKKKRLIRKKRRSVIYKIFRDGSKRIQQAISTSFLRRDEHQNGDREGGRDRDRGARNGEREGERDRDREGDRGDVKGKGTLSARFDVDSMSVSDMNESEGSESVRSKHDITHRNRKENRNRYWKWWGRRMSGDDAGYGGSNGIRSISEVDATFGDSNPSLKKVRLRQNICAI